jgi:magnesium chelatase family protein
VRSACITDDTDLAHAADDGLHLTDEERINFGREWRASVVGKRQQERFKTIPKITCNARMGTRELKQHCALDEPTMELLKFALSDLNLSARAYDRFLKVARTIDDLAGSENISSEHISEAVQFRSLDRPLWTEQALFLGRAPSA